MNPRHDVIVIGGGPAGSIAARQLALLGFSVCLIEEKSVTEKIVGESLGPGITPLLDRLGILPAVASGGFLRPQASRVRWGQDTIEELAHHAGGFLVERPRFDHLLQNLARDAGVYVICPARAVPEQIESNDCRVSVEDRSTGTSSILKSAFVLDASGRKNVIRVNRKRTGPPMLALCAHWSGVSQPVPATVVETAAWGWAWGAPLKSGQFSAIAFVNGKSVARSKTRDLNQHYRSLLGSLDLFGPCRKAEIVGNVKSCEAGSWLANETIGEGWIKVGEAAFTVDPLSSQGVQSAITGALQAAIAVNTILRRPDSTGIASQFYRERQAASAHRAMRNASRLYEECRRFDREPFWEIRQPGDAAVETPTSAAQASPVLSDQTRIRLSPDAALQVAPVVKGNFIVPALALTHPSLDEPVAYVGGFAIERILGPLARGRSMSLKKFCFALAKSDSFEKAREVTRWLADRGVIQTIDPLQSPTAGAAQTAKNR